MDAHESVPSAAPSGILWHAKDFVMSPEVDTMQEKHNRVHTIAYDALTHLLMFLRCSYNHFQTLGEWEAFLIVCPSAVNFGTV